MTIDISNSSSRKLLALDLDGTLLTSDNRITERTRHYLDKAVKSGAEICIATGRIYESAIQFAVKYNLNVPHICANGAVIREPFSQKEYFRATLEGNYAESINQYASLENALLHVFTDSDWYVNEITDSVKEFGRKSNRMPKLVDEIKDWEELQIIKMVIVENSEVLSRFEDWISKKGFSLNVARSDPFSVDIVGKGASKGIGVKILAQILGIKRENIIAVGNYFNDIEMFEHPSLGVAMGNSPDEVKLRADFVTKTNDEDGIVDVIKRFILYDDCIS